MAVTINGTTGIANDGGYTGDGVVFADTTPANTLVTTTGGNVGIGATLTYGFKQHIAAGASTLGQLITGTTTGVFTNWSDATATNSPSIGGIGNNLVFFTGASSSSERARIDSSGNLLVGTTSNGSASRMIVSGTATGASQRILQVISTTAGDVSNAALLVSKRDNNSTTSQVYVQFSMNNDGTASGQINANGANAAAFGSWSDRRLKENIVDLASQLDNILALRPVEFDYIESEGGGHQIGFIAQEMQEVYPDAVGDRMPDGMLTVTGWSKTEARLVKAIQEQQALIASQSEIINAQQAALTALTARVTALENQP